MRIVCPACRAAYEVPAPVVDAGRTLRCTRCEAQFSASAAQESRAPAEQVGPPATSASAAPSDSAGFHAEEAARPPTSGEPPSAKAPSRLPAAVLACWVLSLVVLAGGAAAALAWRQQVMVAWPPSARAYAALGYLR